MSSAPSPSPAVMLRDVVLVARFELLESVRSRRVLVLALLFLVGGGLSGWGFSRFLGEAEHAAASALDAPGSTRPGHMLNRLQDTSFYRDIVGGMVGDPEAAAELAKTPPLALVFAWLAMTFAPLLLIFASSDTISGEVETRSLRYALLRTGRLEYVAGKFFGQLLLLVGVVTLSAAAFLAVSAFTTSGLSIGDTALSMVRMWPWIVVDALPYLAVALGASMLARTAQSGRAIAIAAAIGLAILSGLARASWLHRGPISSALLDLVEWVTPHARGYGLLAPIGSVFARSLALCIALPLGYLALSYQAFRRRDL